MARVRLALTRSRVTEGLARIAAADDVDGLDVGPVDFSDVAIARHLWPVFLEDRPGIRVDLDLPRDRHASALKAKVKPADACKQ
jgi:hypothetical protein